MSRIKVTLDFELEVEGDPGGISEELENVSWIGTILAGLGDSNLRRLGVTAIRSGTRRLQYKANPS